MILPCSVTFTISSGSNLVAGKKGVEDVLAMHNFLSFSLSLVLLARLLTRHEDGKGHVTDYTFISAPLEVNISTR